MNINLTLFGQMLSFLVFTWFCMKYVWPPLVKAMEERQAKIASGLRDAEKAEHELKDAKYKAGELLQEAKDQAARLVEQANKRASHLIDEGRDKAKAESDRIKKQAETDVQHLYGQAKEQLRERVATLAVLGAERILQKQVNQGDHDQMLAKLGEEI